ncbi:unnamed protein product [Tenebrio molitor]|jgi:hypothetical protein|nr:unnamed protein product [Tenebrio molitor]
MSYGFQPPPPYQPGAPPYEPGAPPYQPGALSYSGMQPSGQCAIIRSTSSGLCVDGTEYEIKLQHYNGSPGQLWILEPLGGEKFIIRNKGNGAVMDIEGGPDCGANLITYERHGGVNQQWYINNTDRTIVSAAADLAMDVCDGNCFPGNILIAYDRHGGPNQQFHLQYQ